MNKDPVSDAAKTTRSNIIRWLILLSFLGPLVADAIFHKSALVDQIPSSWTLAGVAAGIVFAGFCSAFLVKIKPNEGREIGHFLLVLMLPVLGAFLGSYVARTSYEVTSFIGYTAKRTELLAQVTGLGSKHEYKAEVEAYSGASSIWVDVDSDLYFRLEPYRQPGRDCLLLPVEVGRNGVRRFLMPAKVFDKSLSAEVLRSCNHRTSLPSAESLAFPQNPL